MRSITCGQPDAANKSKCKADVQKEQNGKHNGELTVQRVTKESEDNY